MPGEQALLERLRTPPSGQRTVHRSVEALQDSVLQNLRRIFNTRQGEVVTVPDYGMPDLTDVPYAYPDSIEDVRRAIQHAVTKYEPRLRGVRVRHIAEDGDPQLLRFEITARLAEDGEQLPVRFESTVNPGRRNPRDPNPPVRVRVRM